MIVVSFVQNSLTFERSGFTKMLRGWPLSRSLSRTCTIPISMISTSGRLAGWLREFHFLWTHLAEANASNSVNGPTAPAL